MPEASVLSGQMPLGPTSRGEPSAADRTGEPEGRMPEASVLSGQMPLGPTSRGEPRAADRTGEPHGDTQSTLTTTHRLHR